MNGCVPDFQFSVEVAEQLKRCVHSDGLLLSPTDLSLIVTRLRTIPAELGVVTSEYFDTNSSWWQHLQRAIYLGLAYESIPAPADRDDGDRLSRKVNARGRI